MGAILVPIRHQLHHDERFEGKHAEVGRIVDRLDLRSREEVIGADLFAAEQQVESLAGLALRAVTKRDDPDYFVSDEAGPLQGAGDGLLMGPANLQS